MEWISVIDRCPEAMSGSIYSEDILGVVDGEVTLVTYCPEFNSWHYSHEAPEGQVEHVTHWMPLPEPPKEAESSQMTTSLL